MFKEHPGYEPNQLSNTQTEIEAICAGVLARCIQAPTAVGSLFRRIATPASD